MNPKVKIALNFMEANLHRTLSLSELASLINVSRSHLSYLFKIETGKSPRQYFLMLKMQKARELLTTTFLCIKEIMTEVGFTDRSHFVRHFRKAYGLSPSRYRAIYLDTAPAKESLSQPDDKK